MYILNNSKSKLQYLKCNSNSYNISFKPFIKYILIKILLKTDNKITN